MNQSAVLGGISVLVSAGVFGDAAARDVSSRMHALFYTSPIRESDYIAGRFLGALTVNAVLLLGVPLGLLLASVMPYMPQGTFGPVRLAAYVQAYLLLLLPNLVLAGTCMFAAAALTRRALTTYMGEIALFVLGIIVADVVGGVSNRTMAALADPFGTSAIGTVTRFWTLAERNAQLIGWPAILLWNRALWLVVAVGALALVASRFRFVHPIRVAAPHWWNRASRQRVLLDAAPDSVTAIDAPRAIFPARKFTFAARARQTLAVAARAFLLVLVGALVFVFAAGWDVGSEVLGTSTWPVMHLIAGTVLRAALAPVMAVLVAIFAGELVWREREVGMGDIAGVAPVPNSVSLGGFVFYNTNVLNDYTSPETQVARRAECKRRYKRYENAPQPALTRVRFHVELYPNQRAAEVRGTFQFVNRTVQPIDSLHVLFNPMHSSGPSHRVIRSA